MKLDLTNQSFEKIRIRDTSLMGGNFVRCNLSESEFYNVDLNGVNLKGATIQLQVEEHLNTRIKQTRRAQLFCQFSLYLT
ncbi:unnamed protein product [Paramecium sonneborni]|uniref:Pentapeptide repeat-containing protein n=1 Tax=Paramecium sonneborni TaxID=65129 RepID=A0A8S1R546_9CILI|nr:unnamed protein product [Paramecium sonneborni]